MRRFNQGYAIVFLFMLVVVIISVFAVYRRVEGRYQERLDAMTTYTLDDWVNLVGLDDWLGDPPVTPFPSNGISPEPTATP